MFYLYLLAADLKWPITICRTLCSLLKIRSQIKPKGQTDKHQHNSGLQVPECVTDSILEVDKVVHINPKQITCVEVQVSLFKYITEPLLLCLLLVPSVANEWRPLRYLPHQQSCLTWWTNTCHTTSNHHQSQQFQQLTFHKVEPVVVKSDHEDGRQEEPVVLRFAYGLIHRLTSGCFDTQAFRVPDWFFCINVKLDQSVRKEHLEWREKPFTNCFSNSHLNANAQINDQMIWTGSSREIIELLVNTEGTVIKLVFPHGISLTAQLIRTVSANYFHRLITYLFFHYGHTGHIHHQP